MEKLINRDARVLVVEDDTASRYLMELIMAECGCKADTAANGMEAIEAIQKNKNFDVVFMDLRMPVMDGIEATKVIRQDISKSIPIVAVTAHAMPEVKQECFDVGMNGFIVKPFDVDKFKSEVISWINKSSGK